MIKTIFQHIQQIASLSNEEVEELFGLAESVEISKGKYLSKPHQVVENAYFLKQGVTRHFFITNKKDEYTKNFIQSPSFLLPSFSSFFLQEPSFVYCEALTDLTAIRWSYKTLMHFADKHPTFYKFLLKRTTMSFKKKELKEIQLYQDNATKRYLKFLDDFPGLLNTIPLHYIASYLNIRPETLSRIRAKIIS